MASSPRISSRLAEKKKSRHQNDDIFEYTLLSPSHKKSAAKLPKVSVHTKSITEHHEPSSNINSKEIICKKRRGRPPKAKQQQSLPSTEKQPRGNGGEIPSGSSDLAKQQTNTSQSQRITRSETAEKPHIEAVYKDINLLVDYLTEKCLKSISVEDQEQLFSMAGAILPSSKTKCIPLELLDRIAKETDVMVVDSGSGNKLMFGNVENLLRTKEKLLLMIAKEKTIENDISIKLESSTNMTADDLSEKPGGSLNDEELRSNCDEQYRATSETVEEQMNDKSGVNAEEQSNRELNEDNKDGGATANSCATGSCTAGQNSVLEETSTETGNEDLQNASLQVAVNDSYTDMDGNSYECIGVIESNSSGKYVSNRQGPKRRQGKCKHLKELCDVCTSYCKLCQYRSTEVAVKKHMQRVHPTTTYNCEVCGMQFGIRYDMRRHRMLHFDDDGTLNQDARTYLTQNGKPELLSLTLADLEVNFVAKTNNAGIEGKESIKTEMTADNGTKDGLSLSTSIKADPDNPDVLCGFCDYTGSMDSVELHHKSRHRVPDSNNLEYLCSVCEQGFPPDEIRQHYFDVCGKEHGTERDLSNIQAKCRLCQLSGNVKEIKLHIEEHAEKLLCHACGYAGDSETIQAHLKKCCKTTRKSRRTNLRNPPKESLVLYKCGICSNIFKTRASLQMHFKSHEVNRIYKCEYCDFQTTRAGLLNAHMRKKHASLEKRRCDICGKVFNQVTGLRFHKESVHGIGRTSHKCPHCSKVFTTKRFLQVHIKRVHFGVKSYFCSVCKKGFFERARMLDHENVHLLPSEKAKKKHVCSFCGKAYSQKSILRQHENTHQGLRPYKCNLCDKSYAFTAQLHKHKVAHRTERPHICVHCGKGFKFPYKLTAHIVTHTKQGRHSCSACNKVYTSRSSLHKHMYQACPVPRNRLASHHFCATCHKMFASPSELEKHQCQSDQVFVMSDKGMETQALMEQTSAEELVVSSNNVMQILADDGNSQIVPSQAEVIMLTSDSMQDIVTAVEPLECGNKMIIENVKPVFPSEEMAQSSILYMCCVCNKLFSEQSQVNAHMELEHESEAVIAQEVDAEIEQPDTRSGNTSDMYTMNGSNTMIITSNGDESCLATNTDSTVCNVISEITANISTLDGGSTMTPPQLKVE